MFSRAMEVDETEEGGPAFSIKPMVLPNISTALKTAWKDNNVNLEKAGIFRFLCWVQTTTRVAYVDRVIQFIHTHSSETETAQVEGRTIDFSVNFVGRVLKLPIDGERLDNMPGLTKKQHENMFEGEFPQSPRGCQLNKAKQHWQVWLKFVNDYLVFRPQKDMMTQKIIVAALHTWERTKVNWSQVVQQKSIEEIAVRKVGNPKMMELFSAFYISTCCEELPRPATATEIASSSRLTQSPSSSPEKSEQVKSENRKLRVRLEEVQTIANEKQEQLIAKGEALVQYQTANVKTLNELAQVMKEKMNNFREREQLKKAFEESQTHVELKDKENHALKLQLQTQGHLQQEVVASGEEIKRLRLENHELKEKLQLQHVDLEKQRELLTKKKEEQLSIVPATCTTVPVVPLSLPVESIVQLWEWESSCPAPRNLFHLYKIQRDLFLFTHGLTRSDWLDHSQFARIWHGSSEIGVENLFAEILARKHLQLSDPHAAFMVIGDMGARVLLYYASLESQWVGRYQLSAKEKIRVVSWQDYSTRISSQFYGQSNTSLQTWQLVLSGLY